MNDRELLEAAAKAAGIELIWSLSFREGRPMAVAKPGVVTGWNPLTDDGDALRLAVKLLIAVNPYGPSVVAQIPGLRAEQGYHEDNGTDPCAATRRAIVRAAASLAKE